MTQPAVSNHLRALERGFGVALVTRGRPLRPTPAGESLARRARRIVDDVRALEEEMAQHAAPCGRLLIGASSTPGELLLPTLAVRYSEAHPDVALDAHISDTDEILASLLRREIEAAVVGWEVEDRRLRCWTVGEDEMVLVTRSEGPPGAERISTGDLSVLPLVLRERGSGTRRAVERCLVEAGLRPPVAMELGSNAAIAEAVGAGAGVGVIPARMLRGHPNLMRLRVAGLRFRRPFVLAVERDRRLSPAAHAFVELCTGKALV